MDEKIDDEPQMVPGRQDQAMAGLAELAGKSEVMPEIEFGEAGIRIAAARSRACCGSGADLRLALNWRLPTIDNA